MLELIMNADKSLTARGSVSYGENNNNIYVNISRSFASIVWDESATDHSYYVNVYLHDVLKGITLAPITTKFISSDIKNSNKKQFQHFAQKGK